MYELMFIVLGAIIATPLVFLWGVNVERSRVFKGYRLAKPKHNVLPFDRDKFSNSSGRAA